MSPNIPVPQDPSESREVARDFGASNFPQRTFDADSEESGPNWKRAKSALWRYKWLVLGVTILGTGGGVYVSRITKAVYSAGTTIWLDQDGGQRSSASPIRAPSALDGGAWLELVKSFAVMDSVVKELRLNVNIAPPISAAVQASLRLNERFSPGLYRLRVDSATNRYTLSSALGAELESGAAGDSIGRSVGLKWAPAVGALPVNRDISVGIGSIRGASASLRGRLRATIDDRSTILRLDLEDSDPVRLAETLNAITRRYIVVATDLRRQKAAQYSRILAAQADFTLRSLTEAEQAYRKFQERTITLPDRPMPGARSRGAATEALADPVFSSYYEMQIELKEIQQDRAQLQRLLAAAADSDLSVTGFERLRAVQASSALSQALQELTKRRADLRALRYTLTDAHIEVQRQASQVRGIERTLIPSLVRDVDRELATRAAYLEKQAAANADNLREIPQRTIEGTRLQRSWALAENLYTNVQNRLQEAQVAEASSSVADVRSLDPAVAPMLPSKENSARILLIAFIGSLGLGSAGALLLDRADSKFRYPDQVSQEMGLTILGAVPHIKAASESLERSPETAPLLESLRAIRLNLVYAYGAAGPMVFTVTSPGRSEGKTFLATQLARVFAENGQRTLVVEGDMRKGVLHRRLSVARRPGLSDYLRGDAAIDQIVQKTKFPQLHVITGGTRFHEAPELLGTQAMAQLLAALRSRYDVILCDSPPLGAGIDPLVLATATGNMLLVLRTGVSHRELTEAKLEVISRLPIRLLGAVLNDVPKDVVFSYYSYYLPGYETSDEARALPATKETV